MKEGARNVEKPKEIFREVNSHYDFSCENVDFTEIMRKTHVVREKIALTWKIFREINSH